MSRELLFPGLRGSHISRAKASKRSRFLAPYGTEGHTMAMVRRYSTRRRWIRNPRHACRDGRRARVSVCAGEDQPAAAEFAQATGAADRGAKVATGRLSDRAATSAAIARTRCDSGCSRER